MLSAYAQDEINLRDNLKATIGLRIDYTDVPVAPTKSDLVANANTDQNYGSTYTHTQLSNTGGKVLGQPLLSPRIGFNWDVLSNKKIVVRGGSGIFTGRIPFAWLGYAYYNNGINYGAFDYKPSTPTKINLRIEKHSCGWRARCRATSLASRTRCAWCRGNPWRKARPALLAAPGARPNRRASRR